MQGSTAKESGVLLTFSQFVHLLLSTQRESNSYASNVFTLFLKLRLARKNIKTPLSRKDALRNFEFDITKSVPIKLYFPLKSSLILIGLK